MKDVLQLIKDLILYVIAVVSGSVALMQMYIVLPLLSPRNFLLVMSIYMIGFDSVIIHIDPAIPTLTLFVLSIIALRLKK